MNAPAPPANPADTLVDQARQALHAGRADAARDLASQALHAQANHAGAHHTLGLALQALRQSGAALEHFNRALAIEPTCCEYATDFARALVRMHRRSEALQVANIAWALPPKVPLTLCALGTVYMDCNVFERAGTLFRHAAAQLPDNAIVRFNHAVTLTFAGRIDEAEAEFDACLANQPTYWPAYNLRSRLRRQTPERNHRDALLALATKHTGNAAAQTQLHCALGKEYEDLGDYAAAFEHTRLGKAAALVRHDSTHDTALVDAIIRAFPASRPLAQGYASDEPIFIVGMPRSGTSLVERILSSHPDVHSAGELLNFGIETLRQSGTHASTTLDPAIFAQLERIDWNKLGLRYVDSTRPQTATKPRFTDKLPHNFLYLGCIANALPNARIVCLRRHPLDTCLSNLRELFMANSAFHGYSFDLLDIGRFYIQFERMMAHWRSVLPGRVLDVDYEALIREPEAVTRRLLAHCELPWHDACLHSERNTAAAATASTAQVRQPVYASAVDRWKQYGALLDPLERLLNDAGIATRA